ncbi:Hypothetical protein A7982_06676 [Minicystis rosea]|nr:Hypothetical protein A7982_06676 [Minicystis rosea]
MTKLGNGAVSLFRKSMSGPGTFRSKGHPSHPSASKGGAPTPETSVAGPSRKLSPSDYTVLETFTSGSTKPQKIKLADGSIKVLKFGSPKHPEHVVTEVLTQKIYEAAGIPTLGVELVEVDGRLAQLTEFVESFTVPDIATIKTSPDFSRHVAADMILSNWDLFKHDNWMKIDGRLVRADLGGALDRRAQGEEKKEFFESEVKELDSMRAKDGDRNPYNGLTDHEIADSIRTFAFNLTPDKIDRAIADAGLSPEQGAAVKDAILRRIEWAKAWADSRYPVETHTVQYDALASGVTHAPLAEAPSDDPLNAFDELASLGYQISPLVDFGDPETNQALLEGTPGHSLLDLLQPPDHARSDDPRELPPIVGAEEMLQESQFGGGLRGLMARNLERLRTGVLIRRMAEAEKDGFIQAARTGDIDEISRLLFTVGKRGEIVFSVNDPFVFQREKEALATNPGSVPIEPGYEWILEMPISDHMLGFLQDHSYISNPHQGGKPSAFSGNPNLKNEGAAGGKDNAEGISNVVLKKQGFEHFWSGVREIRIVGADKHLWQHRSDNTALLDAQWKAQVAEDKATVGAQRTKDKQDIAERQQKLDDEDLGINW